MCAVGIGIVICRTKIGKGVHKREIVTTKDQTFIFAVFLDLFLYAVLDFFRCIWQMQFARVVGLETWQDMVDAG